MKHDTYLLSQLVGIVYTSSKHPKIDNVNDSYLGHYRLSHVNKNMIDRLIKEGILEINDCESLPTCEFYHLDKMTKSLFKKKSEQASDVLGLVHSDVCEPMNIVPKKDIITSLH